MTHPAAWAEKMAVNRPVLICESRKPVCPKCEMPLHRYDIREGSLFMICGYRPPRGGPGRAPTERRCGQRLHVLGTNLGVCLVVGLTNEEYDRFTNQPHQINEMYAELGILTK